VSQRGFDLILSNTDENYDRERHCIAALLDSGVDGLLLTPSQAKHNDITALVRRGVPFVLVGRHFASMDVNSVVADDRAGAEAAAEHLIRLGHRRVLFVNAPEYISSAEERREGFFAAFAKSGVPADQVLMRTCIPRLDSAYNTMKSVLVEAIPFTAVFAFSDLMMLGIFRALRDAGRKVPGDVSLVGFDDIEFVSLLDPPLTTVHMPKYRLGMESARGLLALLGGRSDRCQMVLPTELIVRSSTARVELQR
jgi:LacI family transcriptional regulator